VYKYARYEQDGNRNREKIPQRKGREGTSPTEIKEVV
jgi:hypothetical protein